MIVVSKNHDIKQDLRELLRVIFNENEIIFLDDLDEGKVSDRILYTELVKKNYEEYFKINLIEKNLNKDLFVPVNNVEVFIEGIDKKRNIALKKGIVNISNSYNRLPWGILTGIRPMKIIHRLMDKDISDKDIRRVFKEEYLLWDEKIDLLLGIAKDQRKYLLENERKYSLYISIPFCPSRCLYCSFPSLPIGSYRNIINKYIEVLIYEIEEISKMMSGYEINTVYIGGGTPTSLNPKDLEKVIRKVNDVYGNGNIKEFTVEAGRPDTLDYEYLSMLKENNVDRISINPQTMQDSTLKLIGRNHKAQDIIDIYKMAKSFNFKAINMDLIVGLPGERLKDIKATMREIEKLQPNNLTIHSLALKTNSKFYNNLNDYEIVLENQVKELSNLISGFIEKNDYKPYYLYRQKQSIFNLENIGYTKLGYECVYNISMMEERETILSAGMGGVSKIYLGKGKIKRLPNFKGLEDYLSRIDYLINRRKKYIDNYI